jgi:hypothetical protein
MGGICICGCGGETLPCTITNKRHGLIKGQPNRYIKGHNRPWLGKKRGEIPDEQKKKMRDSHLGKKYNVSDSGGEVMRRNMKKATTPENRNKTTMKLIGRKQTPEHVRNAMRRRPITTLEQAFQKIIDDHGLPYRFVGNGAFIIDGLNPDFININGEKIAIEVYARMFKEIGGRTVEKYKADRIKRLSPYGWTVYFFDETQVKAEYVLKSLEGGYSN